MKIGIMDSGLGGLSVLHCARRLLPGADYIYYADEDNVPYGEKSPAELKKLLDGIFAFLLQEGAKAIIIACNTATTVADADWRRWFGVPVVGMEPAVKPALQNGGDGRKILVAATPLTIHGSKLHRLIEGLAAGDKTELAALPGLVELAEQGDFNSPRAAAYLRRELAGFDLSEFGTVVLGCTHFNYFKAAFREVFGGAVRFADGNLGTVRQLLRLAGLKPQPAGTDAGEARYYFSGRPVDAADMARIEACLRQLDKMWPLN